MGEDGRRTTSRPLAMAALVVALLLAGTAFVYVTGGTRLPALHVLYVPILVAAFAFRIPGGLIAALAAGLLVGPWMPLDTAEGTPQPVLGWTLRILAFTTIGLVAGYLQEHLDARLHARDRALDELAATQARVLATFARSVATRDEQVGGHCERVGHNSCRLAEAAGLDRRAVETIHWSGLLHDLGKIGVPERILLKPARLTQQEFAVVKRHSGIGAGMILSVSEDFRDIAAAVRAHHERWDGTGYPDGLARDEIPLSGRIIGLVDVFEALTSFRPYRDPIPVEEAFAYLVEHAGAHFDPELVPLFADLLAAGEIAIATDPKLVPEPAVPTAFRVALPVG